MIEALNKAFESRVRLGIMAVLVVNDRVHHNALKQLLDVTDGNLASHINGLVAMRYVKVTKRFIGKRPNTAYQATAAGMTAFKAHVKAMDVLIKRDLRQ